MNDEKCKECTDCKCKSKQEDKTMKDQTMKIAASLVTASMLLVILVGVTLLVVVTDANARDVVDPLPTPSSCIHNKDKNPEWLDEKGRIKPKKGLWTGRYDRYRYAVVLGTTQEKDGLLVSETINTDVDCYRSLEADAPTTEHRFFHGKLGCDSMEGDYFRLEKCDAIDRARYDLLGYTYTAKGKSDDVKSCKVIIGKAKITYLSPTQAAIFPPEADGRDAYIIDFKNKDWRK